MSKFENSERALESFSEEVESEFLNRFRFAPFVTYTSNIIDMKNLEKATGFANSSRTAHNVLYIIIITVAAAALCVRTYPVAGIE